MVSGQTTMGAKAHTDAWRDRIDGERDKIKKQMQEEWLKSNSTLPEGKFDGEAKIKVAEQYKMSWEDLYLLEGKGQNWQGHHIHSIDWGGKDDLQNIIYLPQQEHAYYAPWFTRRKKEVIKELRGE